MRIVVSADGIDLDAPASPVFGRCPIYILVDTETLAFQALENPAINAGGGAGIQAAQFVVEQGAEAVISGNVGPNALDVLQAANVPVYLITGGSVRQAVDAFRQGSLPAAEQATTAAHTGTGMGGQGRGMGATSPAAPAPSRQAEIASLQAKASDLRQQLAEIMERIDRLEKE